jgi:integrase
MPAKDSTLPRGVTLRKDGRYMWRCKYEGKQYSGYEKTAKEAEKALRNKKYELEHGIYSKASRLNMDTWFETWISTYRTNCKPTTIEVYRKTYKRYISPEFGKKQLKALKPEQIQKLLNRMAKTYSKSVFGNINFLLYDLLDQAVKNQLILQNPMQYTTRPATKKREKRKALSRSETTAFLAAAESSYYYDMFRLSTLTGLRIGEVTGLQWQDVDLKKKEIHVQHTLAWITGKGYFLQEPKSENSQRTIPLPDKAVSLLRARKIAQGKHRLAYGEYWQPLPGLPNLVFTTRYGTPIDGNNIRREMRIILAGMKEKGTDITWASFHTLRHTFATRCIEEGMKPKTLQHILGHATLAITMDLYCDVMEDTKREEMAKIADAL